MSARSRPRRRSAADAPVPQPDGEAPRPASSGHSILVVEDEPEVRRAVQRMLERMGHVVRAVGDAEQALDLVRAGEPSFELVLSDVLMPGMTGIHLATRLHEMRPALPVLLMSGYYDPVWLQDGEAGPRRPLLSKPFSSAALEREIQKLLD